MGDRIIQRILDTKGRREQQNMVWNMIGSFCYAFASMALSFLVMRLVGEEQGGIFAFAFGALGQQMFNLAYFGLRPYHVTDDAMQFGFGDYLFHRRITCAAAVFSGSAYLVICMAAGRYHGQKAAVILLMILYKVIDGYADVYESEFQRSGNLHLTGKSNTFRTLLSVCSFLAVLVLSRHLVLSCIVAVAAQAAGVILFDCPVLRRLPNVDRDHRMGQTRRLFQCTVLLFLSVFLDFYILSAGKYAIDLRMTDADSGYYNILFMPTMAINLAAGFVIRPFLTRLAEYWNQNEVKRFRGLLVRIAAVIIAMGVLSTALAVLLGPWALRILELLLGKGFEGRLVSYHLAFVVIVAGGGFYAMVNLMYYALVIMRRQTGIFLIYAAGAALSFGLAYFLVGSMGLSGAALSYFLLMAGLTLGFFVMTWLSYRKGCAH